MRTNGQRPLIALRGAFNWRGNEWGVKGGGGGRCF
jgi:hypothetical protein